MQFPILLKPEFSGLNIELVFLPWHGVKLESHKQRYSGYCPDVAAYSTIIKGLCKEKWIREAKDILNEILGKGLAPSVVTYNLLIDGNTDQAVLWFSRMTETRRGTQYHYLHNSSRCLCNAGKLDDAHNLWIEMVMEHKGCCPNRIAYMARIHRLCKC
ncbi:hypothetical protein C2S51_036047 [Perilla frutescens var. frutescens]|nr:hypothetical protein C2S51_036047 [Perilla frutescens var. frutescens]